jgi:hypothetical protein
VADIGCQFKIASAVLRAAFRSYAFDALGDVRAASPSVSVIVFIGNRPAAQSSTARSLFLPEPGREPP